MPNPNQKVFGMAMSLEQFEALRFVAEAASLKPSEFARQAINAIVALRLRQLNQPIPNSMKFAPATFNLDKDGNAILQQ